MTRYGGLSAGPMPDADQAWVHGQVRVRFPDPTEDEIEEATDLAIALYETAASYGVDRSLADGVTSFIDTAIDAVRARDRRP